MCLNDDAIHVLSLLHFSRQAEFDHECGKLQKQHRNMSYCAFMAVIDPYSLSVQAKQ